MLLASKRVDLCLYRKACLEVGFGCIVANYGSHRSQQSNQILWAR